MTERRSGFLAPDAAWWAQPAEDVLRALGTGAAGLSTEQATARRTANSPPAGFQLPRWALLLLAQFRNPLVLILAGSALAAAVIRSYVEASIILAILLLSAIMGFGQEWRAARTLDDLADRIRLQVRVRRRGAEARIPAAEVVPGDILLLRAGDLVAADARLLSAESLFSIEAPLTGEPFPVAKSSEPVPVEAPLMARRSALWAGTSIRSGTAEAVAVTTGRNTVFGTMAATLERREEETATARGLRRLGLMLSEAMIIVVLVVFSISMWLDRPVFDSLAFALALVVGLTPQMLPAIIAFTTGAGARRLAHRGLIVRRLSAVEAIGSIDVLCTDKTGTLTAGTVAVARATDPTGRDDTSVLALAVLNARLQRGMDNAMDAALIAEAVRVGLPEASAPRLGEVPYDFQRRRLSVVVAEDDHALMITKGAAATVMDCCATTGLAVLNTAARSELAARVATWNDEGFRVLAVATRRMAPTATYTAEDETGMDLAGFLLFVDPLRPDARATLGALRARGVSVRIVTGDSRAAALHVAVRVGIRHSRIVTGSEIAHLGADALARLVAQTHVFAEMDPAGKERIVAALRRLGHVTGYLGDGINDATALRLADIGLSVAGAADVARDAADMILTSSDLRVVLDAVDEGRRAFANTQKYLRITMAANLGNMLSMAMVSFVLPFLPMTAAQILLNNLLSDIPMLALAGDRVDIEMRQRPHRWQMAELLRFAAVFGLLSSGFDLATFWVLVSVLHADAGLFQTAWFIESLMSELLFALSIRTVRPVWASRPSAALAALSVLIGAVALAVPWVPGLSALGLVPLGMPVIAWLAVLLAGYLAASEAAKRLLRPPSVRRRHNGASTV